MYHQDNSTKINVPRVVVQSQSDITAFRQDLNCHASAVCIGATVITHEPGSGAKNSGYITEGCIVNHLLNCRGEDILCIYSDCAPAGRNYVTTVATAAYIVDNELASIVLIGVLENCHGKFLCDLLFGQFQRKARNEDFSVWMGSCMLSKP